MRPCTLLFLSASLFAAEVTEIGERAWHVVLPASERQVGVPNPAGLPVFITSAKGTICWDPRLVCVGPAGSNFIPQRDLGSPQDFVDPLRPAGALVHRTAGGQTRLAVNDRDNDEAFADNTGQYEFDVFLAPQEETEAANTEWIRSKLIPISTAQPGTGVADLRRLDEIVGRARIVALGEATHGTREFFQLKHRILEYLATERNFGVFTIEASMPEAYRLNDYVLSGVGDPAQLVKGMGFWTWSTEEVLDMVRWMRDYNASGRGRLQFTGFDMQSPVLPAQIVREFVTKADPDLSPSVLRVHRDAVIRPGFVRPPVSVALATIPTGSVAGRRVQFSGHIKTEGIGHGYAALTWRITVPGGAPISGIATAATGTTDWTRYELNLSVPANATAVAFGVTHPGDGIAWFDDLALNIAGVPFTDSRYDFDFENTALVGLSVSSWGYSVELDESAAFTGRQSLRSRFVYMPYGSLVAETAEIVDRMEASRDRYQAQGLAPAEIEWAIQNARLVHQYSQLLVSPGRRDEFMAKNIQWIAEQNPESGVVVWAHNGHVAAGGFAYEPMGSFLRRDFREDLVTFGFGFNQGGFQAIGNTGAGGLREFVVDPAPSGSFDAMLGAAGAPLFALDLRAAPRVGSGSLVRQTLPTRVIGAVYGQGNSFFAMDSARAYDAIVFVETTTRARPLP